MVTNSKLKEKLASLKQGSVEFFRVDIGENILLDAWMMKPPDFKPAQRYPVIFYVYSEPASYPWHW